MISRESIRARNRKAHRIAKAWPDAEWTARDLGIRGTTPSTCSCSICGNPRKHFGNGVRGLTMQERRASEVYCETW